MLEPDVWNFFMVIMRLIVLYVLYVVIDTFFFYYLLLIILFCTMLYDVTLNKSIKQSLHNAIEFTFAQLSRNNNVRHVFQCVSF